MGSASPVEQAHGTFGSYLKGFVLSLLLTIVPFAVVMTSALSVALTVALIAVFAIAQIAVHLVFFLHLNRSSGQQWNRLALVYTLVLLAILVGGSIWIMAHLDYNMMVR